MDEPSRAQEDRVSPHPFAGLAVTAALTIAGSMATAAPASADPVINRGSCESSTTFHAEQAPGQIGNGPLTVSASGVVSQPAAFAGAVGCSGG